MSRRKKSNEEEIPLVKVLLLIIILIIFAYVIQGLTYLFELISQYKLVLGIVSLIIIALVVSAYGKYSSNTISKKSFYSRENIIDVTPAEIKSDISKPVKLIESTNSFPEKDINTIQEIKTTPPIKQISESVLESKVNHDIHTIIEFLGSNQVTFLKKEHKNEESYQSELFHQLRIRFPEYKIDFEADKGKNRLDLLLNDSIGIEMKIYNGEYTSERLLYQINKYSKDYLIVIGLVVNLSIKNNDIIKQDIEKHLSSIKQDNYKIIVK
jgi:hypothetical protein